MKSKLFLFLLLLPMLTFSACEFESNAGNVSAQTAENTGADEISKSAAPNAPGAAYFRLYNRYTKNYLHCEYGQLQMGSISSSWYSAMWRLDSTGRLFNRWKNAGNDYTEKCIMQYSRNGLPGYYLDLGAGGPSVELLVNTSESHEGYTRLRLNRWSDYYLNTERGFIGDVHTTPLSNPNWWSADWILEPVGF